MPTLNWIGKDAVVNHHKQVPFRLLKCNDKLSVGDDSGNLLVQGDNLEALKALLPYYAGQVKCIYIDPPYNTGEEEWIYNDNVNSAEIRDWLGKVVGDEVEDLSRHDKWLCMMYPQLLLLKSFLKHDGIIFISIGKDEIGHLRLLTDEIFSRKNLIEILVWNTEGHTENQDEITAVHEYIFVYASNIGEYKFRDVIDPNVKDDSKIRRDFAENSITKNTPKNPASIVELPPGFPCEVSEMRLPAFLNFDEFQKAVENNNNCINRQITRQFSAVYPLKLDPLIVEDYKLQKTCRVFSGWSSLNKLKKFIENDFNAVDDDGTLLSFYLSKNGVIYYRREGRTSKYIQSVLRNMGTTEKNKYELEAMGIDFPYPKPKELIQYLIEISSAENDLVLDAFAGSGTTAHATLLSNAEHEKFNRRFIMVEMNKDVAQTVTARRLASVIEGYKSQSGQTKGKMIKALGGGFRFCELGATLFDANGQIREEVTYNNLAQHVYFIEAGQPLPPNAKKQFPLLGVHNDTAVYLLYNGVLKDKSPQGGNILTRSMLLALPKHDGPKIVYGNGCLLSEEKLRESGILFRQIPYEVRAS